MRLTKKKVEKIKAAIADGTEANRDRQAVQGISRSLVSDIATGRVHKRRGLAGRRAADAQAGRRPAQGHPRLRPDRQAGLGVGGRGRPPDRRAQPRAAEGQGRGEDRRPVQGHHRGNGAADQALCGRCRRPWTSAARPRSPSTASCTCATATTIRSCGRRKSAAWKTTTSRSRVAAPSGTSTRSSNGATTRWPRSSTFPVLWVLAYGDYTSGEIHQGVRAVLLPQPIQQLPGHRPVARPDVPRPGSPLRASQRPLSGRQPRPADAEEGLPRCTRQLGLPRRRGRPAALPRSGQRPLHDSRCVERQRQHQRRRLQRVARGRRALEPGHPLVRHGPPAKGPDRPGRGGRCPAVPLLLSSAITMPPALCRTWTANCWSTARGSAPILRLQLLVRLPRAVPMDSRRQCQARHHLADELSSSATRTRRTVPSAT